MSTSRGMTPAKYIHQDVGIGNCRTCDKHIFLSRKAARKVAKDLYDGASRPRPYPCPANPDHWHVGHIPTAVRQGVITKDEWNATKQTRRSNGGAS